MATYTAGDQIKRALRLLGVLAEGEEPSAEASADSLMALVQMLDSWSIERLSVFDSLDQVFTWPAGQTSRTLGPTGDFTGERPVMVDDSTYFVISSVSYPISLVNEEEYNSIVVKSNQGIPSVMFVNASYPNIEMKLYPIPSDDMTFHIVSGRPLAGPPTLATVLAFPPGYLRAFAYCLACEIATEFGMEPPASVERKAISAKRNIKRINNPEDLMSFPSGILARPSGFNWYTGQPS